jgi:hypothetical protein
MKIFHLCEEYSVIDVMRTGMKSVCMLLLSSFLIVVLLIPVHAEEDRITPYGDYCKECGSYGTCEKMMSPDDAAQALIRYYRDKGYSVGMIYHKGRFLRADIYKGNEQVDKVLFDRKTGRIRSIY